MHQLHFDFAMNCTTDKLSASTSRLSSSCHFKNYSISITVTVHSQNINSVSVKE